MKINSRPPLGKYLMLPAAYLAAHIIIGYLALVFVLTPLIAVRAKKPRLVLLGLVVMLEWLSAQPPGIMTVTILIPWFMRPNEAVIDLTFSYLWWVVGTAVVQWHVFVLPQIWHLVIEQANLTYNWPEIISQWPWVNSIVIIGWSSVVVFGATVWQHFSRKQV